MEDVAWSNWIPERTASSKWRRWRSEALAAQLDAITAVMDHYERQAAQIRGDGTYTPAGQQAQLTALQQQTQQALAKVTAQPSSGYARHLAQLKGQYRESDPVLSDAARLTRELRASEIRRHVQGMGHLDAHRWYQYEASPEQQKALETAPVEIIPAELQARVKASRLAQALPELHAELSALGDTRRLPRNH